MNAIGKAFRIVCEYVMQLYFLGESIALKVDSRVWCEKELAVH